MVVLRLLIVHKKLSFPLPEGILLLRKRPILSEEIWNCRSSTIFCTNSSCNRCTSSGLSVAGRFFGTDGMGAMLIDSPYGAMYNFWSGGKLLTRGWLHSPFATGAVILPSSP
jgi:hypothetical protein